MKKLVLFTIFLLSGLGLTAQLHVDITPSKDNTIFEDNVNNSDALGYLRSGETCSNGSRRSLLYFDIASNIPAGVVITAVSLDLNVSQAPGGAGNEDYTLHTIIQDWGEGTSIGGGGTGAAATAGDATWNESFFGTTNWGTAGGSFIAAPVATTTLAAGTGLFTWTSAGMVSDVQNWLTTPAINFGWTLIGDELTTCTARRIDSKDIGIAPVLHVFYTCPGTVTASCQDMNVYLDIAGNANISESDIDAGSTTTCPGALSLSASQTSFNCTDIVTAPIGTLFITGVIDGPLVGGTPKAIELYANNNIADLSIYGIGSANNGGGSDGEEFTFPAVAVTAGTFIYVTTDATEFMNWFGFPADYVNGVAPNINGDDAIELFMNSAVIDVFGDINVDGTGEPWEYMDGWAYRNTETGPDGSTFVLGNWSFSAPNALDGETSNGAAATPFPAGTFSISPGFSAQPITLTVTDDYSNTDNCISNIILFDTIAPTVTCIGTGSFSLDGTGNLSLTVGDFDSGSSDACGIQSSSINQTNFNCLDLGSNMITLTVIDIYGNTGTCVSTVDILESNPITITVDNVVDLLCFGDTNGAIDVTVAGGTPAYTFDWDNDGLGDNDDVEDITGLTSGNYILVVTDASSCDDSVMVTVTDPGNMDPTFAITNESCSGDGAIDMTIPGGVGPYVIDWDNDGTGDNDDTEDLTGLTAGTYTVTITDANNCMVLDSATIVAGSTVDTSVTIAGAMMTSNQATGTYVWVNCPSFTPISGATSISYTATLDGDYAVIVTNGTCTDTSACITIAGVGFKESKTTSVRVFPNPTSGMIQLDLNGYSTGKVVIYDINARALVKKSITSSTMEFDLSGFENGIYFVEISTESGLITRKIALQH
jgi:SprB repeat/Secretion system C-terminal sorting domain